MKILGWSMLNILGDKEQEHNRIEYWPGGQFLEEFTKLVFPTNVRKN